MTFSTKCGIIYTVRKEVIQMGKTEKKIKRNLKKLVRLAVQGLIRGAFSFLAGYLLSKLVELMR